MAAGLFVSTRMNVALRSTRLFKRGQHLLAVGLEFQFPGERVQVFSMAERVPTRAFASFGSALGSSLCPHGIRPAF